MARIRSFLAVNLGKSILDRATALQHELRQAGPGGKWVEPESMHVTLVFLGELDDRELFEVCRIATKVAAKHQAFEISCRGVGAFPNERRPKILWAGIDAGSDLLKTIQAELSDRLVDAKIYQREDRDFTPHLTLGRIDAESDQATFAELIPQYRDWSGGKHFVNELLVMGSELRRSGPEYTVLGRAAFA